MLLKRDQSPFYRVKRGQTAAEVEKVLHCPAGEVFAGAVIHVVSCKEYRVQPFESYCTLAKKFGIGEEELKEFNYSRVLYPSCKIYVPESYHRR